MNGDDRLIVIVEDSPTQAEHLRHLLERNGFRISVARNGAEGLETVRREMPLLVLSDIVMPEMDGFTLCALIKRGYETKHIPVMILTSLADPHDILKGVQSGADSFLTKPYDEPYLLNRIHHLLTDRDGHDADGAEAPVELLFDGERYTITSGRRRIVGLLLSVYEAAVRQNRELTEVKEKLESFTDELEEKVEARTAQLKAEIEERRHAEEELSRYRRELEELVARRTDQLRETVARLEQSNHDLEQFAYVASHDLQEPLRMVVSYMQLLERKYEEGLDDKARVYIHYAVDGASRMQKLIEGLLDYSRISRGAHFTSVDTGLILSGALANLEHSMAESGATVESDRLPVVYGDETQLLQLFQNIIGNGLKYRKPDTVPILRVRARLEGRYAIFSVEDNGIGIEPEHRDRIFQVFQRLHTREEYAGTGIGLALCKKIVERHGGRIWVESDPGRGATFYFTLPSAPEEPVTAGEA